MKPTQHPINLNLVTIYKYVAMVLFLACSTAVFGQNDDFGTLKIRIPSTNEVFEEGLCGFWQYPSSITTIDSEFCAPLVWAHDFTGDSLCCDSIANDYTGKIVLIRRGACEFCRKAIMAEQAGAVAVIVVNHYNNAQDNGCSVPTGICELGSPIYIPMFLTSRVMGEALIAAVEGNGGQTEICLDLVRMLEPRDAYHYLTPYTQVDSLKHISIRCINRGPDTTNVTFRATIKRPDGQEDNLSVVIDSLDSNANVRVTFPPYLPPAIIGVFKVVYSTNLFTEPRDTLNSQFVHTNYSFGTDTDILTAGSVGLSDAMFAASNFKFDAASLYFTGPNGGEATYVTFGIANTAEIFTPDPSANIVGVTLFDADYDEDGVIDLVSSFSDLESGIVATGEYVGPCIFANNKVLFSVPLTDVLTGNPSFDLKPSHPYYVLLSYDGLAASTGRCIRYVGTTAHNYCPFPSTPYVAGGILYDGFPDNEIVQRLEMEGFTPFPPPICLPSSTFTALDVSKYQISPNPASDWLVLDLNLQGVNDKVTVSLVSPQGNILEIKVKEDIREGKIVFDTNALPSGSYLVRIRTEEGSVARKVVVLNDK